MNLNSRYMAKQPRANFKYLLMVLPSSPGNLADLVTFRSGEKYLIVFLDCVVKIRESLKIKVFHVRTRPTIFRGLLTGHEKK